MMTKFSVQTHKHTDFINITTLVQTTADIMGVKDDILVVCVPHTTAGITINENTDPDVMSDLENALDRMVPWKSSYKHCEGNSAAHVKASLMGASVQVPVEKGRLQLGTWQGIYFCEFDGPRNRVVHLAKV